MIKIKSAEEIAIMRKAGAITRETLLLMEKNVKPGVTTKQLDELAYNFIVKNKATPSFLNYGGFPATICASVNEQVVHGIPNDEPLKEGDIVSIDVGACYKGYHGDSARTFAVGKISPEKQKLIDVTKQSFFEGIKLLKDGVCLGDVSAAIQRYVEKHGFSVVRDLVGHGVGRELHEDPAVPNYGFAGFGPKIHKGTVLAIEPMVNMGTYRVNFSEFDGWTVTTEDGKPSAHYENTVLVTEDGVEILT